MIHFAFFAANVFFNPNISQTTQTRGLKFVVKDREALMTLEKMFHKMQKF